MSRVKMLHLFERLMGIHSNPPILYYDFNFMFVEYDWKLQLAREDG